jgi:predicted DNA-binding WGR domain protein
MPRYELVEGTSSKFWEIVLEGKSFTTKWGRIGTAGQSTTKSFATAAVAKKEHEKLIAEKTKKGYTLVEAAGSKPAKKPAKKPAEKPAKKAKKGGKTLKSVLELENKGATLGLSEAQRALLESNPDDRISLCVFDYEAIHSDDGSEDDADLQNYYGLMEVFDKVESGELVPFAALGLYGWNRGDSPFQNEGNDGLLCFQPGTGQVAWLNASGELEPWAASLDALDIREGDEDGGDEDGGDEEGGDE